MYWDGLDTDTKARLIRNGLRMGMRRWESVRDDYDAAEERRLAAAQDCTDDDGDVIIDDPRGQWAHPGEVTRIPSNEITMRGVPYLVVGVSDTGDTKIMEPGYDYVFEGSDVTEYPARVFQHGGALDNMRLANAMANRPFGNTTVEAETARLEEIRRRQEAENAAKEAAHRKANQKLSDDLSGKNGFWTAMATSLTRSGDPLTSGSTSAIADDANRLEDVGLKDDANRLRALSTGIGAAGLAAYTAPYWLPYAKHAIDFSVNPFSLASSIAIATALSSCNTGKERDKVLKSEDAKELINRGDSLMSLEIQMPFLHGVENANNKGYDSKSQKYYSYPATENSTTLDIGDGLKLTKAANPNLLEIYKRQIDENGRHYITKEQHDEAIRTRISKDYVNSKHAYNNEMKRKLGEDNAWDNLNSKEKAYLMDFEYNVKGGIATFPKLMKAIHDKDLDTIKKESLRYEVKKDSHGKIISKKQLGRNKEMLQRAEELYIY